MFEEFSSLYLSFIFAIICAYSYFYFRRKTLTSLSSRIENYWTKRTHDFNTVRRNELENEISNRWLDVFHYYLPSNKTLKILDIGTGTGYFAVLLSKEGHDVTGIDLTKSMIEEAKITASDYNVAPTFIQMDAQSTSFANDTFDAIVTRNLTWTLPDPQAAYREWYRILKKGGILLNFDADYAENIRNQHQKASYISASDIYGHCGITSDLEKENNDITLSMPCSLHHRPDWDLKLIKEAGFSEYSTDENLGKKVLREHDLDDAPLFLIHAKKF